MSNITTVNKPSLFDTAKYGTIAVIVTVAGIILSLFGLGTISGFASLVGLVLAIISLVKHEKPKWPAVVTLIVSLFGVILFLIVGVILVGLLGIALL